MAAPGRPSVSGPLPSPLGLGLPDPSLLARWNPKGFAHPKAMLAGPGEPRLFNMSTWVGSLTVLSSSGRAAAGDGGKAHEVETRMYLTCVNPSQPTHPLPPPPSSCLKEDVVVAVDMTRARRQ